MNDEYHDTLGQGHFCNSLWQDAEGLFCSIRAMEGRSACCCPYTEEFCHVVEFDLGDTRTKVIQCGGEPKSMYACMDFEPSPWLREKMLGKK